MSEFAVPPPMYAPPAAPPAPAARDRARHLMAQLVWEGILLVLLLVVLSIVGATGSALLGEHGLWLRVAWTGLVASGLALSLRTATPNLAVGAIAVGAGTAYAKLGGADWPVPLTIVAVLLGAAVFGALLGLFTGLTGLPAWAVSLFGMVLIQAVVFGVTDANIVMVQHGTLRSGGPLWTVLFLLVSFAGGALWLVPGVRRTLSAGAAATGRRSTSARLLGAVVGLGGSTVLAAAGGMLLAASTGAVTGDPGVQTLLAALAAVLLGGVSVFGRRAGVAGTALAVFLLVAVMDLIQLHGVPFWVRYLEIALALLVGLFVTWLLDVVGRSLDAKQPAQSGSQPAPPYQ